MKTSNKMIISAIEAAVKQANETAKKTGVTPKNLVIYPNTQSGRSYLIKDSYYLTGLPELGIEFSTGNSAPRGGKLGFFVSIPNNEHNRGALHALRIFLFSEIDTYLENREYLAEQKKIADQIAEEKAAFEKMLNSIVIDDQFRIEMEHAGLLPGVEKSNAQGSAFRALLIRCSILADDGILKSDFWELFRIVKKQLL